MIPLPSQLGDLAVTALTEELRTGVPLALKRAVARVADERGLTVSRFVREAVADRVVREAGIAQIEALQALPEE